ncbi:hypothetical protein Lser_V15G22435 [Lactuca serriola]
MLKIRQQLECLQEELCAHGGGPKGADFLGINGVCKVLIWQIIECAVIGVIGLILCYHKTFFKLRYYISGSFDAKVCKWSIPDRQVFDWSDLHEMVTAACYTPDGQVFTHTPDGQVVIFPFRSKRYSSQNHGG